MYSNIYMKKYLLTFKTLQEQFPTPQLYYNALEYIIRNAKQISVDTTQSAFEADKTGKLHYHVVVYANYVRFKPFAEHFFKSDMYFHFIEIQTEQADLVSAYLQKAPIKNPDVYAQLQLERYIEQSIMSPFV